MLLISFQLFEDAKAVFQLHTAVPTDLGIKFKFEWNPIA